MDNNFRPENCAAMAAPRVNKEIWGSMTAQARGNDIEYQLMSVSTCITDQGIFVNTVIYLYIVE